MQTLTITLESPSLVRMASGEIGSLTRLLVAVVAVACSDPEPTAVTQVIGPAGGTIEGPAGASLEIPSGALAAETSITIKVADTGTHPPLDAAFAVAGKVFAFEPHGLAFASPVTITLPVATTGADLVALRSTPSSPWEVLPAEIAASARISTTSFSWYCIAHRASEPPIDAGVDAAMSPCDTRSPASAPTGTVSDMMGTAPAHPTQPWPDLAMSTIVDGYAELRASGSVLIQLTDHGGACGMWKQGIHKIGGKAFQLFLYAANVSVGTYTGQHYTMTRYTASPTTAPGACTATFADGMPPSGNSSVTITAIDASHVAGSFSTTYLGQPLSGTFDVPVCSMNVGLDPPACCAP